MPMDGHLHFKSNESLNSSSDNKAKNKVKYSKPMRPIVALKNSTLKRKRPIAKNTKLINPPLKAEKEVQVGRYVRYVFERTPAKHQKFLAKIPKICKP